jgi:hypothetical protein
MWKIHNNYYDLTNFLDIHPGGKQILKSSQGIDATAAFESYHAFSDMSKIKLIMEKYKINNHNICSLNIIPSSKYTFSNDGFYHEVKNEVKKYMKNKNTKLTYTWLCLSIITLCVYIFTFIYTFLGTLNPFNYRIISSLISGTCILIWGLHTYHDATHSAISTNKSINKNVSIIGSALLLWDWTTWIKHHSILHHSFTGDYKLDPDMKYTVSFLNNNVKKNNNVIKSSYISILLSIFPGLFFSQALIYLFAQYKQKLLGFKINNTKTFIESLIILTQVICMIYGNSVLLVFLYLFALNINYSIAILPDHDLFETKLNYKHNVTDWGEIQVRHSGNFAQNNIIYTRLYGGINYQIEHHLFPSLNSYHLPEISIIVQEVCKKHNIKYISHPTIFGAYCSAIKNLGMSDYLNFIKN